MTIQESAPAAASAPVGDIKQILYLLLHLLLQPLQMLCQYLCLKLVKHQMLFKRRKFQTPSRSFHELKNPWSHNQVTPAPVPVPVPAPALATAPTEPAPTDKDVEMAPSKVQHLFLKVLWNRTPEVSEATKAPESNGKHDLEDKNDEEKF